eukprot:gene5612-11329_t
MIFRQFLLIVWATLVALWPCHSIRIIDDELSVTADISGDSLGHLSTSYKITPEARISGINSIKLYIDPPNGTFSPTALGAYLWTNDPHAQIFYSINGSSPNLGSRAINASMPYLHLESPAQGTWLNLRAMAARYDRDFNQYYISDEISIWYQIESNQRRYSFAYFIPGLASNGNFLRIGMEMEALARAQLIGGQEYADFYTFLGIGPYENQLKSLPLLSIDPDLTGFEGGFTASVRKNSTRSHRYGYLVPYYNGNKFFGKVVRIDLHRMGRNISNCMDFIHSEYYNTASATIISQGVALNESCVAILDLESMHPRAVGFRRGFTGTFPYGFLSPGEFDVAVRIDLAQFSLESTKFIVLTDFRKDLGGYSGGFSDGTWACYSPLRTFEGPIGEIRSTLPVDMNHLRPYFHGQLLCINDTAWEGSAHVLQSLRVFNFEKMDQDLRGFSNAIRVGRFAYFCPYANFEHKYSSKVVRLHLGSVSIGDTLDMLQATVLELSIQDPRLRGFTEVFNAGKYIYFAPFRSTYEPENGQRGSGVVARVDLNIFDFSGLEVIDMPVTPRPQTPSFPEEELRGFSGGFASGQYGVLVPYYNGAFSGKSGRFNLYTMEDVQELDLTADREPLYHDIFKGFRGGFVSHWSGVVEEAESPVNQEFYSQYCRFQTTISSELVLHLLPSSFISITNYYNRLYKLFPMLQKISC